MAVIGSRISPQSEGFKANAAQLLAQIEQVRALEQAVIAHSAQQADKFSKRGQILPRERVARLLDRGAPFLELSILAGWRMHDDDGEAKVMGGGLIIGIGVVSGKRVLVSASDSAIKGGTISPMGLRKALRALMQHAVAIRMREDDPTQGIRPIAAASRRGFHTWDEVEIAQFEARYPVHSKPRLALALGLFTGQARQDVVAMGPQHVRDEILSWD